MGLREQLKIDEGWRDRPYKCPAGHNTIGYGWNMDVHPLPKGIADYLKAHGNIKKDHGETLLSLSINLAAFECEHLYTGFESFPADKKDALINFMFNVGPGTAREFKKANAAINRGDWQTAAAEMKDSKWYRQVGQRAERIIKILRGTA